MLLLLVSCWCLRENLRCVDVTFGITVTLGVAIVGQLRIAMAT